jgi:orotate phosphoribosyltransferase
MDIHAALEECNALVRNSHIVYTSGRHGSAYVNKDALYPRTDLVSLICSSIADHFAGRGVEVVAAPAVGGVALSQWTAHHLSKGDGRVLSVYAEKAASGAFELRRGYDRLIERKNILVVEDIVTTGGSLRGVVAAARSHGANVIGAAILVNRGAVSSEDLGGLPELLTLADIPLESWSEEECPLCRDGAPVNTSLGKGHEFLNKKRF